MKKRLLLGIFLGIMLIGLVSAQYGYYGSFSLSNFLDSIGSSTLILLILFIIFFAVLHNLVFMTFFRRNRTVSAVVSFCVSLLAVYGINRARWDLGGLFYGLGIPSEVLSIIIPIILLVASIYIIVKLGVSWLFLIFGIFLTIISLFTDLIYERGIAIAIGLVLLLIGGILLKRKRRRAPYDHGEYPGSRRPPQMDYQQKAKELGAKLAYERYRKLEEQKRSGGKEERRDEAREARRQKADEERLKGRYVKRFGKGAWKKREKAGP